MKFGQKIGLNDILDEFENNYVCLKKNFIVAYFKNKI